MVIKSHPAPEASQRGCLWWRGFPNTGAAAFQVVRLPVLQGSSGYQLCGLLLGQFLNSQAFGRNIQWSRPGAWPPHSRLQFKGSHKVGFTVCSRVVFPREGKQLGRTFQRVAVSFQRLASAWG